MNTFNEDDTPVFSASLKAAGNELNLVGAKIVIHYDLWWNLAVQSQATDGVHQIGQTKSVQVYQAIAIKTTGQRILQIQENKKAFTNVVISNEINVLSALSI
ncbi:C-terminal helicase domain-containing protein [[Mycoplasma] testudinis]|uniref:C-terminal helicase domain-containing protein n=1 Tax=[Mycoplasma] testudinis TaxID=33924 RepID=UPI000486449C|nr:C-terminal helicase domain-containing protein [[Mycoplasma] testudinis]